ncbi:MAG: hypothetical protein ACI9N3_000750, partial [Colwellia sp.]
LGVAVRFDKTLSTLKQESCSNKVFEQNRM